ncbi:helix-turn-helix transcriptional regulator [Pseudomonas hunanensis]|nr:helix-turn-helix transcriptional regulator [Pseudomonas hunanensis]
MDPFSRSSQRAVPGGKSYSNRVGSNRQPTPSNPFAFDGFPELVGAIGTVRMPEKLLAVLHGICGADHFAVFEQRADQLLQHDAVSQDGSNRILEMGHTYIEQQYWKRDPVYQALLKGNQVTGTVISRINPSALEDRQLRSLYGRINAERIVLSGPQSGSVYGLHVLRERRQEVFSSQEIGALNGIGSSVISVLAKHVEVFGLLQRSTRSWRLDEIEQLIHQQPSSLSLRERSVCARIIYGMSSTGIALDLGIGEESVKTYRKRAYLRLGIGSAYELNKWFTTLQCTSVLN